MNMKTTVMLLRTMMIMMMMMMMMMMMDDDDDGYLKVSLQYAHRLNKKDGLTRYGNSHVKDKTS